MNSDEQGAYNLGRVVGRAEGLCEGLERAEKILLLAAKARWLSPGVFGAYVSSRIKRDREDLERRMKLAEEQVRKDNGVEIPE